MPRRAARSGATLFRDNPSGADSIKSIRNDMWRGCEREVASTLASFARRRGYSARRGGTCSRSRRRS